MYKLKCETNIWKLNKKNLIISFFFLLQNLHLYLIKDCYGVLNFFTVHLNQCREFPGGPVVRILHSLSLPRSQVESSAGELKSHKPHDQIKKKKNQCPSFLFHITCVFDHTSLLFFCLVCIFNLFSFLLIIFWFPFVPKQLSHSHIFATCWLHQFPGNTYYFSSLLFFIQKCVCVIMYI